MKYDMWRRARRVEAEFRKALEVLCDMFDKIALQSAGDINYFTSKMNKFQNSFQYEQYINSIVERMVTPLDVANQKTWREAAKKATRGQFFYDLLIKEMNQGIGTAIQSQIIQNANLIRTLPSDTAQKVAKNIAEATFSGMRASEIEKIISKETNKHSRASARLIARTEVSKTQSALTRARSEELGLNWYVWRTARDGNRVRKSHRIMEGVIVNWNDPPSPEQLANEKSVGRYHAGEIWNCRCYAEPLLEIQDVLWPHKVYYNGRIQNMAKGSFEKIM